MSNKIQCEVLKYEDCETNIKKNPYIISILRGRANEEDHIGLNLTMSNCKVITKTMNLLLATSSFTSSHTIVSIYTLLSVLSLSIAACKLLQTLST